MMTAAIVMGKKQLRRTFNHAPGLPMPGQATNPLGSSASQERSEKALVLVESFGRPNPPLLLYQKNWFLRPQQPSRVDRNLLSFSDGKGNLDSAPYSSFLLKILN
jgi:hypothetical protein